MLLQPTLTFFVPLPLQLVVAEEATGRTSRTKACGKQELRRKRAQKKLFVALRSLKASRFCPDEMSLEAPVT